MSLHEAALRYAAMGWKIFPLKPGLKTPATRFGFKDAVDDTASIDTWWTYRKAFADRNIGIRTGKASGIWVLDADIDKETGELGEDTLEALCAEHGPLPRCPVQLTPKGGKHFVFRWPEDGDVPRRIRFADNLDALGERDDMGGYFIGAPSLRQDGEYKWLVTPEECPPPLAPQWLVDIIRADAPTRPADLPYVKPILSNKTTAYGRSALRQLCEEIATAPFGAQEVTLGKKAVRISSLAHGGSIDIQEAYSSAYAAALQMPSQKGHAPWTAMEIEKKLKSAFAKGAKDPTKAPEPRGRRDAPSVAGADRPRPQLVVVNNEKPEDDDEPKETFAAGYEWALEHGLIFNEEGQPKASSLRNLQIFAEHHPSLKGMYVYDRFRDMIYLTRPLPGNDPEGFPRELTDYDETALAAWLNWHGLAPSIAATAAIIREVAFRNAVDPLKAWVDSLTWDGKKRVDGWLSYYAGVDPSPYADLVGKKFLISGVARALDPGCKVDTMLILEGPQGLRKSSLVRELSGREWFSDQVGDVTNKDSSVSIQGCWVIEIPEMDKFLRSESSAVKDFLARLFDRYRPPYGRNMIRRERRCLFFGTINPDGSGYLKDFTGNRRYWPVECKSIDLDAIRADREQIWAEAREMYLRGEAWWIEDDEVSIVEPEQEARRDDDVWEPRIRGWLDDECDRLMGGVVAFTSADILHKALGLDNKSMDQRAKNRIARILKMIGCAQKNHANKIRGRSWEYERRVE